MRNPAVDAFTDYLLGRETQQDDVGAVARWVAAQMSPSFTYAEFAAAQEAGTQLHGHMRPSPSGAQKVIAGADGHNRDNPLLTSHPARWDNLEALRTHANWAGPNITQAQITAALAAAGVSET